MHSLAYFYNWCFAQVATRYSWKWDGDMVLTTEGEVSIADLGWQVGDVQSIIRVPRHGLYLDDDRHGYLDLGLRNAEEWGFPIGPDFVFTKAFEWEIRTTPVAGPLDRPAARPVRRAEVPRRRRVRALDRPGVLRDVATATSASAASGRSSTPCRTAWCLPGSTTSSPPKAPTSSTS